MQRPRAFLRTIFAASLILGALTWAQESSAALKVATWNTFRFGPAKFKEPDPFAKKYNTTKKQMMVDVIEDFDLVAIQEYFDASLTTMKALLKALNAATGDQYDFIVGPRVGGVSKEQYAFIYKKSVLKVVDSYTYADPDDLITREPFIVRFSTTHATVKDFFVATIHTEPDAAVEEMNALVKVYDDAVQHWNLKSGLLMGDMNSDCQYVRKSDWPRVTLFTDPRFQWFIPTGTDTASMTSECTFDRIITASDKIRMKPGSLQVWDFVSKYKIEVKEARQLSDHFPVGLVLE